MSAGRFSEIPIQTHRAPPTKNRVLHKESQGIPAVQARFRAALLAWKNQILNKKRQTIHDSPIAVIDKLGRDRILWVIQSW
jgi:hypothetical protein